MNGKLEVTRMDRVRVVATAELPTRFGAFRIVGFRDEHDGKEHVALVRGEVNGEGDVLTRLHSECLTGDAFGSMRCDCREQLWLGLERIAVEGRGVLLYLRQEGRGIGLLNKLRAYSLQDCGLDTVEANLALGFADDQREYGVAAAMLATLRVRSVRVLTNNPRKVEELEKHGVVVAARLSHVIAPNEHNRDYLATKARRSGHLLNLRGANDDFGEPLEGQRSQAGR